MLKITGFDQLEKDIKEAEKAIALINGNIGNVKFDPQDPQSIDDTIQQVDYLIDKRLGRYSSNPFIKPVIHDFKEKCKATILEKAAAVHLLEGQKNGI